MNRFFHKKQNAIPNIFNNIVTFIVILKTHDVQKEIKHCSYLHGFYCNFRSFINGCNAHNETKNYVFTNINEINIEEKYSDVSIAIVYSLGLIHTNQPSLHRTKFKTKFCTFSCLLKCYNK